MTSIDLIKSSEDSFTGLGPELIISPKDTNPFLRNFEGKPPARPTDSFILVPNLKKLLLASIIKNSI